MHGERAIVTGLVLGWLAGLFSAVSKPILQPNTRWEALTEICTVDYALQLSSPEVFVKNLPKFCQTFISCIESCSICRNVAE